ncbi:hypothetical protein AALP_AAs62367U000700 [Arabis alpina]|uniref:F-box associated beta-propeller type 1 domain-containing protein n=1 Tax=Arabis alpina TaxID=50452 RepID=A0A087G337_ARAAL|nr:hypothetical protein AALP_AAs62367U000700 [Arabis alpina]
MRARKRERRREIDEGEEEEEASPELPNLPLELVMEILLRSPVRSVGRFRDLTAVELDHPFKEDGDFFSDLGKFRSGNEMLSSWKRNQVKIVGSSNGLVCIYQKKGGAFLYIPITGDSKKLPDLDLPEVVDEVRVDFEILGFGFDVITHDYKVVKFVIRKDGEVYANVYSLKTDSWKRIRDMRYRHVQYSSSVVLNGAIHWIVKLEEEGENKRVVAAFDLKTQEFRDILLPDEAEECNHFTMKLDVSSLKGCLCVFYSCFDMHNDIWVMNKYGLQSSWCKIRIMIPYTFMMKPLCSTKNDEEVLLILDDSLILYNFKCDTWRSLGIRRVKLDNGFEGVTYIESLVSPNSYG